MRDNGRNLLLLALTAATFLGGYAFLRYAYGVTDSFPFTQEIVLIMLGTLATVLITALLLNKQTQVEIEKEQSIKFIELKTQVYDDLLFRLEEISLAANVSKDDIVRLQFITHKLAIVSSPPVLEEYEKFLEVLRARLGDREISRDDSTIINERLANLTVKIRADLIGELDARGSYTPEQIRSQILENSSESMELSDKR